MKNLVPASCCYFCHPCPCPYFVLLRALGASSSSTMLRAHRDGAKGCMEQIRESFLKAGVLKPSTFRWREPVGTDSHA